MGKHTVHGFKLVFCDWTGVPLPEQKAVRYAALGPSLHFMNYRCMLSYAKEFKPCKLDCTRAYVYKTTGNTDEAPDYRLLSHFGGTMSIAQFVSECEYVSSELAVVKVDLRSKMTDHVIDSNDGSWNLEKSYPFEQRATVKGVDLMFRSELNGIFNELVYQMFGVVTYGDTIIARVLPNGHLGPYTLEDINLSTDKPVLKRKTLQSQVLQQQLQQIASAYESKVSSTAVALDQERVRKVPRASGAEVAAVARQRRAEEQAAERLLAMRRDGRSVDMEEEESELFGDEE